MCIAIVMQQMWFAGVRLLQKMGWRQGKGVGTVDTSTTGGSVKGSRWGRVAGVGVENTPLYALKPKESLHGLGFDPFKVRLVSRTGQTVCTLSCQPTAMVSCKALATSWPTFSGHSQQDLHVSIISCALLEVTHLP